MRWLKRILIALVLLLIAVALPFFISLDDYIPLIEKELSSRLDEPVSIKTIRFAALPVPQLTIEDVAIGAGVHAGRVRVTPDLATLLDPIRVIRRVEIDGLSLTQQAVSKMPGWAATNPSASMPVRIDNIVLSHARVRFAKVNFGPFDAHIRLGNDGEPEEATMATLDGKVRAHIRHGSSGYLIDASAKSWKLPVGPMLVFDALNIKGVVTASDLRMHQVSATLYGGTALGNVRISWQKLWRVKGAFEVRQVETHEVAAMLSSRTHVSGKLSAKPAFAATAASAEELIAAVRLSMPFSIEKGVLQGLDIEQAATHLSKKRTKGGETRFEELSGHLFMENDSYYFTQLKIASGVLSAGGNVAISPSRALSGRINAQVNLMGAGVSVPLNVTGTLDDPALSPTRATMTGAAVGTLLLGPGVGTALGAKIGGWIDDLFTTEPKQKK